MTKRQFVLVVVDRDTGEFTVEGPMSDDRLWNSAVVECSKGRPQHPMLQHRRYCRYRCNRMALVLRGSQNRVWLDRVGLSPRAALTKGRVRRPPGPPRVNWHIAVNAAHKWPLSGPGDL